MRLVKPGALLVFSPKTANSIFTPTSIYAYWTSLRKNDHILNEDYIPANTKNPIFLIILFIL